MTQTREFWSFILIFLKKYSCVLNTSDLSPAKLFGLSSGTSNPYFLAKLAIFIPSVDK